MAVAIVVGGDSSTHRSSGAAVAVDRWRLVVAPLQQGSKKVGRLTEISM